MILISPSLLVFVIFLSSQYNKLISFCFPFLPLFKCIFTSCLITMLKSQKKLSRIAKSKKSKSGFFWFVTGILYCKILVQLVLDFAFCYWIDPFQLYIYEKKDFSSHNHVNYKHKNKLKWSSNLYILFKLFFST